MTKYKLKLASGKIVEWTGESGEDAARRYVEGDPRREAVVAFKSAFDGLAIGVDPRQIIG